MKPTLSPEQQTRLNAALAEIDLRYDAAKAISAEAERLTEAALPRPTTPCPSAYYDFDAAIARAEYVGRRSAMKARLIRELHSVRSVAA